MVIKIIKIPRSIYSSADRRTNKKDKTFFYEIRKNGKYKATTTTSKEANKIKRLLK